MSKVDGYVWCDFYGEVHADIDDPMQEGPQHVGDDNTNWEPQTWTKRTDPEYSGELMFFKCPGEHKKLETV
jgi:hypothetical protein